MNFPSQKDTFGIFNNLFAFFGMLDLQETVVSLQGKLFEHSSINPQSFIGKKFSDLSFLNKAGTSGKVLKGSINEISSNKSKTYLDFTNGKGRDIFVQLFLNRVFDEEENTEFVFFCALEVAGDENSRPELLQTSSEDKHSEIEKANREKDFFLAFMSHELRSPLNTILGWSKILLTRDVNETSRRNAIETIEKSARIQAKLIDDLVESARISSGKIRLETMEINLCEIVRSVYDSQKPLAEQKNVEMEFVSDKEYVSVFGDAARLRQMILILTSNALKTTRAGGHIKISLETPECEATLKFDDNGDGINPDVLPDLFNQFQQNDGNKSFSSNALEMSIVKILAEKHNGRVKAESPGLGLGSTFTVILPLPDSLPIKA